MQHSNRATRIVEDQHCGLEVELLIDPTCSQVQKSSDNNRSKVDLLVEDGLIEVDNEGSQHQRLLQVHRQQRQSQSNMPPAPFERTTPTSPSSMGDEAGMEALWVEELVSPSSTGATAKEELTVDDSLKSTKRKNSFFQKRMSNGGLPWNKRQPKEETHPETEVMEKTARKKKVLSSVRVLTDDGKESQLQLHSTNSHKKGHSQHNQSMSIMEQRQSSFGEADGEEEREPEFKDSVRVIVEHNPPLQEEKSSIAHSHLNQSASKGSMKSEATKAMSVKSQKARELLAAALHEDTPTSQREKLAGDAYAEATAARLLLEGPNPPKGLDLVLRAASHKGRSAALAAAFSENSEQQSRAKHYMDLILPIKAFPIVDPPPPPPRRVQTDNKDAAHHHQDGDLSTLGFDNTFSQCSPRNKTVATGGASGNMSPLSMSSLNEILDGPIDEKEAAKKDALEGDPVVKYRLPFLKKRTNSPKKEDPPVDTSASRGMSQDQEAPPPVDAIDMDDNGSWTDASLDETGADQPSQSKKSQASRKTKRVFRLARIAGLVGAGTAVAGATASSSPSGRSGKRGWLRRNKSKDCKAPTMHSRRVVDHVPTPPPNVPYQSKGIQRYVANVEVDSGSKSGSHRGESSKEVSTVTLKARDAHLLVEEKLNNALLADETEHITSYDGVKMFGQNIKTEEELAAEAEERAAMGLPPRDEIPEIESSLSKRSIKIDPHFISAPAGEASILTAKSWDSLIENEAARWEDQPRSMLRMVPEDEKRSSPHHNYYNSRGGDPPQLENIRYVESTSPRSLDSAIPGLTDKYSSTEEPHIDDKYSMYDKIHGGRCTIIATANSFETEADEDLVKDLGEESEDQQVPDTPRRRCLKLGILSRIQSRRPGMQQTSNDDDVEDEEDEVMPPETPISVDENRKPRRKLKLFKPFQNKKRQEQEDPIKEEDEEEEETPVDEVVYEDSHKNHHDLMLQATDTLTEMEEFEIEDEEDEDIAATSPKALKSASSDDSGDPLIRSIRKQANRRIKRGRDPSTRAAEVTRGLDP